MTARRIVVSVVVAAIALGRAAQAQVPAGPEFRVNVYTTDREGFAHVASDAAGNFVVVWTSYVGNQAFGRLFGRRFDATGAPLGTEFLLATDTVFARALPVVALDSQGNTIAAWLSNLQDGDGLGVFAQRYDAAGGLRGVEFRVNLDTAEHQSEPAVASDPHGNFVVAWTYSNYTQTNRDVFMRRFHASGVPIGSDFRVNTYTTGRQQRPRVARDASGGFVVAWEGYTDRDIFARRFDGSGTPLGSELRVNTYTTGLQWFPDVSAAPNGSFVVCWESDMPPPGGSFARRFDASGTPSGAEFRVDTTPGAQPTIASDSSGNFVVAWWGTGLFAQRFEASGARRGGEFQVNTPSFGGHRNLSIASDAVGNFVVVSQASDVFNFNIDVMARRFGGLVPAALSVDPAPAGNRVLEPGETAAVRASWRNINGAPQTFGGGVLSFTGPAAAGVAYQVGDGTADYGTVANGSTAECIDCFQVAITFGGTRPAQHWDTVLDERITPDIQGQQKPWTVHVGGSFTDVATDSIYYRFIETLLHRSVTGGCTPTQYCPSSSTTREQMAVFVLVSKEGAGYAPPACGTPLFNDVPASSPFCRWVEELARRGVVSGCGSGNYCPQDAVTREQMAVFVLRTLDPALNPPACTTPRFDDVPASSLFCRWIEELARRGVVTGCTATSYCPADPVTREQMGVFLSVTFGLTLYGP